MFYRKPLAMNNGALIDGTRDLIKNLTSFFVVVCALLNLPACSAFSDTPGTLYIDPFTGYAEYAEGVFIRQNQATSEIMMLTEDDMDPYAYEDLLEAEKEMQKACELLNEYAVREIEGQTMGLFFKRKVQSSVEGCEYALQNVESTLAIFNSTDSDDHK